ncbi:unnamed protein product [Macrosiphum euphorbiae]|uniref:Uncharacterized protein n=1 Tax=Macrosiphum euphorbiae TaxID=13131 RepID=A0AAV0Y8K5_9HEMI|nr:unnamed protein product [Macrosiphum euphorbiae]
MGCIRKRGPRSKTYQIPNPNYLQSAIWCLKTVNVSNDTSNDLQRKALCMGLLKIFVNLIDPKLLEKCKNQYHIPEGFSSSHITVTPSSLLTIYL